MVCIPEQGLQVTPFMVLREDPQETMGILSAESSHNRGKKYHSVVQTPSPITLGLSSPQPSLLGHYSVSVVSRGPELSQQDADQKHWKDSQTGLQRMLRSQPQEKPHSVVKS